MKRAPIEGYEGYYEVGSDGSVWALERVINLPRGKARRKARQCKITVHPEHGYSVVSLSKEGIQKQFRLHILVAKAFIPNPEGKPTVNHRDGIKSHNWEDNLEWATNLEQTTHAREHRLLPIGNRNAATKIRDGDKPVIRDRILAGELIQDVARDYGVSRNTITKAMTKAFGTAWDGTLSEKRARASNVRWNEALA